MTRLEYVASCLSCKQEVCVMDCKHIAPKLRRHKTPQGGWCSPAATFRNEKEHRENNRIRQAAYRRRVRREMREKMAS